jgi:hypothetical protein
MEQNMANFQMLCLDFFVMTQRGPIQKMMMPMIQPGRQPSEQLHQQQQYQHEELQQNKLEGNCFSIYMKSYINSIGQKSIKMTKNSSGRKMLGPIQLQS